MGFCLDRVLHMESRLDDSSNGDSGLVFPTRRPGDWAVHRGWQASNADYDVRHNVVGHLVRKTPWKLGNGWLEKTCEQLDAEAVGISPSIRQPLRRRRWMACSQESRRISTPFYWRANQSSNPITRHCGASAVDTPCFRISDFVPTLGETDYGNVARNSFYGPGYFDSE